MKSESEKIEFGRKLYSVKESYWIFYNGIRTLKYMFRAKRKGELDDKFMERIMLAVTEVNQCAICSYAHTKRALESGMSNEEIQRILSGIKDDIPDDELVAVMFAQHYADTRGHPTEKSWQRIVKIYGKKQAISILGAVRTIMIGNTYGIPWSSFINRFKGGPDSRSSLSYELEMMITMIVFAPVALVHALISGLSGKPVIQLK